MNNVKITSFRQIGIAQTEGKPNTGRIEFEVTWDGDPDPVALEMKIRRLAFESVFNDHEAQNGE